jgi:glycosyltransferase involved in cell wall biosynthesis
LYVPSASVTANAFYRAQWLRRAARCPVAVVGLQRRRLSRWGRRVAAAFEPDALVVTSESTAGPFRDRGWNVVLMDLGIDPDRFRPVEGNERKRIRAELGWTDERPVVLHVGHLRAGRGLDGLADLAAQGRHRVVMVASVSEGGEEHLAGRLVAAGVELHHGFVSDIQHYYQASDLYLFPVANETSAVDFPLSVLEALACGRRVLTTPHGALPDRVDDMDAVHWLDPARSLADQVDSCLGTGVPSGQLEPSFGWDAVFGRLFEDLRELLR